MLHGRLGGAPWLLLAASLGLQALGLGVWTTGAPLAVGCGLALFASGSGLATLVRPFLLHELYGPGRIGELNERLARAQQLARAAGPVVGAAASAALTYRGWFAILGCAFMLMTLASLRRHRRHLTFLARIPA